LVRNDILAAADGVMTGRRLGDCLRESRWLPPLLLEMTAVGEETGSLEETLDVINTYYTGEVNTAVSRALGILEPCIILVLAGMVIFILLSVYLPLFSMYGSI
jgi:type IV pilus assembly protein PilC